MTMVQSCDGAPQLIRVRVLRKAANAMSRTKNENFCLLLVTSKPQVMNYNKVILASRCRQSPDELLVTL